MKYENEKNDQICRQFSGINKESLLIDPWEKKKSLQQRTIQRNANRSKRFGNEIHGRMDGKRAE